MFICLWLCSLNAAAINLPPELEFEYGTLLSRAEFVVSNDATPPQSQTWHKAKLPHSWQVKKNLSLDETQSVWYRISITDTLSSKLPNGLYLERSLQDISVFLNDDWLGGSGNLQTPPDRNWNKPHLLTIPKTTWQASENTLFIRLIGDCLLYTSPSPRDA